MTIGKIAVLLSTYNGGEYLIEQLESLLNQSFEQGFTIYIRDDGSTDNTVEIITQYTKLNDNVIILPSTGNLGAKSSFFELIQYALKYEEHSYFMFSDQDDVWMKDKIKLTMKKMREMEEMNTNTPLLVHTDLTVVDNDLKLLSKSFWKYQRLNPEKCSFNRILIQNVVTGCTSMFNRKLAELCIPISSDAIMHDWWIALIASAFGKIGFIERSTILYRQHANNTLGAKKIDLKYGVQRVINQESLQKYYRQAQSFFDQFESKLNTNQREVIIAFISINTSSFPSRIRTVFKYQFLKIGYLRNIGFLVQLFIGKK